LPDAYRPPLYTLLVAAFLYLKLPLFSVILFQNILGGLSSVLIYRIGIAFSALLNQYGIINIDFCHL